MENIFPLLKRVMLVLLGYVAASSASALILLIGALVFDGKISDGVAADRALRTFLVMNLYAVLWPAVIGILLSEALAIRSWKFHMLNIVVSASLGWLVAGALARSIPFGHLIVASVAGGFAYWVVAGATAGFYKPVSTSDA
jgi:hypothetical protein